MADTKISDLTAGSAIQDADIVPGVQGGANVKFTGAQIQAKGSAGNGTIATQAADNVNIDGGTIDGTIIGANSAAAATVSDLTVSGTASLNSLTATGSVTADSFSGDGSGLTNLTVSLDNLTDVNSSGDTNPWNLSIGESRAFLAGTQYNTAIGFNTLSNVTHSSGNEGRRNTAVGYLALQGNTTGDSNTVVGHAALRNNTGGSNNVAIGRQAGLGDSVNSVVNNSVLLGYDAGKDLSTANDNILVGYRAGDNITSGDNNIIIGTDIDAPSATGSNQLNIGNTIYGDLSTGNVGIGTTTPTAPLDVNGDTIRVRQTKTPASASASGSAGEIAWDSDYIYVCVATDTWKRTALTTW